MARRICSLRKKSDFARLRSVGRRFRRGLITISFHPEGTDVLLACAIPKKVGGAVVRNRMRRRIKAFLATYEHIEPGLYVVSVAPGAASMTYQEIAEAMLSALAAHHEAMSA